MGFFFADLVWFLNRLVYIFSAKFCKWKKTFKRDARREESAVFMGNKEFFPDPASLSFDPRNAFFPLLSRTPEELLCTLSSSNPAP